jgi:hypothetical protein
MYFTMRSPRACFLAVFMAGAQLLRADSVTLKSGETVTGTIKSETDTEVTVEIQVSSNITDERVLEKSDIAKIDKEQPDDIAYAKLAALRPDPLYSLTSENYFDILSTLTAFETQYPASSHLGDVKKLAATFQAEKDLVDKGEVKYLGEWLSPTEGAKRQAQLAAVQYYNTMQQQAAAGQLVEAMQTFSALEKSYPTTRSYPTAVMLARQVVARLQQDLVMRAQQVKSDQDQLKKTIAFTAYPEKTNVIAAARAEQDRDNAVINEALRAGQKWVPIIPRSKLSIDTLQRQATSEATRLASIPAAMMMASLAKTDAARVDMQRHNFAGAENMLNTATTLWNQNEEAKYLGDKLKDMMAASPDTTDTTPAAAPTP